MKRVLSVLVILLAWAGVTRAQLMIPSERTPIPGAYAIKSIAVDASIKDQVAEVQVSQVFRNLSPRQMEVEYIFPVPSEAAISQFTLLIDGKEVPAKMYTKEEAQRIYESIVRTKQDPAILEYMGYGALKTSVFPLPPNGERKITLRYAQVCKRDKEVSELIYPLMGGKLSTRPVEQLTVTVRIDSPGRIKSVYCPSFPVTVERPSDQTAVARFTQTHVTPAEDFRLFWHLSEQPVGATLFSYRPEQADDGYFLMLASPEVKATESAVVSKTVVFVIDRSGSMAGKKIEQAKNALKFVLNNLRENDTFNIVVYDDRVETFKPELQRFTNETRQEAIRYVDSIHDGGSTNIDGALRRALELVGDASRPSYVIFLTDGLPTSGEKNPVAIANNAKNANRSRARLFAFGVGFDVNARLLDQLTTDNSGVSEYVKPNDDIEGAVAKFYGKMSAPVMTAVKMELSGGEISRVYPREIPDLFAGGQIIAVGRYKTSGPTQIRLSGKVGPQTQSFEFPAHLAGVSSDQTYGFVEKLWATRRVGDIINELDLKGKNQELIDELVRLSTKHGILTPYTAFLADERTDLSALSVNRTRAEELAFDAKDSLAQNVTGSAGVNLRAAKADMQYATAAPQAGAQAYRDAEGQVRQEARCQVVGNKALYRRANRWVDPDVTTEEEKKAEVVEQFSDKYFELARNNARLRQYLALPEGCTIKMDGKVYQINAAQQTRG